MISASFRLVVISVLFLIMAVPAVAAEPNYPEVVFILDASGSMWARTDGQHKIHIAKKVMKQVVPALPGEVRVGLVAYGHRKKGDCKDVETLVPPGSQDREGLLAKVEALSPKGKTPLANSVQQTAEALKTKENETTIVLISDGVETCHNDPCRAIEALKKSGIKFVLHVVGFGVDQIGTKQLGCLARAGGGEYYAAKDTASLLAALQSVKMEVAKKVEKAKTKKTTGVSRLGKLKISLPTESAKTLAGLHILRVRDSKIVKQAKQAAGLHPLLEGKYKVQLLYANTNYRKPDAVSLGQFEIEGGQTKEISLGALAINIAEPLGKSVVGVELYNEDNKGRYLLHLDNTNRYYMFRTRPLPAGSYRLGFVLGRNKEPSPMVSNVKITAGQTITITLDSGIQLKKAVDQYVKAWRLTKTGKDEVVLEVARRFDNAWPLWEPLPVPPGKYDLWVSVKGMSEPLPVGEGLEIKSGETLVFDIGL